MKRQMILSASALGFILMVALASVPVTAQTATPTPIPFIVIRPTVAIMPLSGINRTWRLRVRAGASRIEPVLFDLTFRELVTILGISPNLQWFYIRTANGRTGWVYRFYMDLVGGHIYNLPVIQPPALPALTPTPHP